MESRASPPGKPLRLHSGQARETPIPLLDPARSIVQACSRPEPAAERIETTCVRTSAMPYYLGIDGGGTKTRCLLADETTVLADAMTGGSNIVRLRETQARAALHAAVRQVCAPAKIAPAQIHAICIGAARAATPEIPAKISSILAELAPEAVTKIEVVADTVITLEPAFGPGPAAISLARTASIL